MEFLFIDESINCKVYILILRNDLYSYIWMWPASEATAKVAASALANWIGSYGTMDLVVSHHASHFKNEIMQSMTEELLTSHHFTTPYSPWAKVPWSACEEKLHVRFGRFSQNSAWPRATGPLFWSACNP